jgi:hypothetical protein
MTAVRDELHEIEVVRPVNAGCVWKGVQHGELVDTIDRQLQAHGVQVTGESWFVSGQNKERLSGSMTLKIPGYEAPAGSEFSLGLHHGNDCAHALKFAVGLQIFICSNGMVSGDFVVRRRHTLHFDVNEVVGHGLDRYLESIDGVTRTVDSLKARAFWTDDEVDGILMEAGREGLMPWSRIGQVDAEYRHPTFEDHAQHSGWGLYNAFTYVVQKSPPGRQIDAMSRFRDLILN